MIAKWVESFHVKFVHPWRSSPQLPPVPEQMLRYRLLKEEWEEYLTALDSQDLVGIADALGDMVYVIYGTAGSYGIDLDLVVELIHNSNMTKSRQEGVEFPGKNILKGADYSPPNLSDLIRGEANID